MRVTVARAITILRAESPWLPDPLLDPEQSEEFAAERAFCPWPRMQKAMRADRLPMATSRPNASEFRLLGFACSTSLTFRNF